MNDILNKERQRLACAQNRFNMIAQKKQNRKTMAMGFNKQEKKQSLPIVKSVAKSLEESNPLNKVSINDDEYD